MPESDHQLLLDMHAGKHAAAATLWERHAPRLLAYVRSLLRGDIQAAEDVVQTVMMRLLELRRRDLEAVTDVPAWLVRLCRNQAIGCIRASRRRTARELRIAMRTGSLAAPCEVNDLAAAVEMALNRLPWRLREPILLRRMGGLSFEQIALATGQARAAMADRYRAGIEAIRADLSRSSASHPRSMGRHSAEVSHGT